MKTLILGAGVIGLTYGWQLAEAGHDVTVLVRSDKLSAAESGGELSHAVAPLREGNSPSMGN